MQNRDALLLYEVERDVGIPFKHHDEFAGVQKAREELCVASSAME